MSKIWGLFCIIFGCGMLAFGGLMLFSENDMNGRVLGTCFLLGFGAISVGFSKFKKPEEDIDSEKVLEVLQKVVDEKEAKDGDKESKAQAPAEKPLAQNKTSKKKKKKKKKRR